MLKFTLQISLFHLTSIQLDNQESSVAFFMTLTNKQKYQKERNFFYQKQLFIRTTFRIFLFIKKKKKNNRIFIITS